MSSMKILVLDDQVETTTMIARYLGLHDYTVDTANDPHEGMEIFEEKLHRCIITDVQMPRINGLEVLRKVKKRQPSAQVLVMSAFHDMDVVISCLERGASDFLVKPIKDMELFLEFVRDTERKMIRWLKALRGTEYVDDPRIQDRSH